MEYAEKSGARITFSENPSEIKDVDVVYTDVWCSMGEESFAEERIKLLKPFQVNSDLMNKTGNKNAILLHCLPAVKGNEVTEEVFEKHAAVIFDQAENRMHTIKAVMVATAGK